MPKLPLAARFWAKVDKQPESAGGHWLWSGATCSNGYGHIRAEGSRNLLAHRLSLAWATGHDGVGQDAAHDDSRGCPRTCVNPAHLSWKSHSANMKDVIRKNGKLFVPARESKEPLPLLEACV